MGQPRAPELWSNRHVFGEFAGGFVKYNKHRPALAVMAAVRPLIGIPADRRMLGLHPFHVVGDNYARAVLDGAGGLPLLIPALAEELGMDELLARLDGVMFTGSASNVSRITIRDPPASPEPCTIRRGTRPRCLSFARPWRPVFRCWGSVADSRK